MHCVKTLSIDSHSKAIREAMSIREPKVTKETISLHLQERMKMVSAWIYKSKTQRVSFQIYPNRTTTLVVSLFQKHQWLVTKRWTLWVTWVAMSWKFQWIPTLTVEWASLSSMEHRKWPTSIKRSNVSRMKRSLVSARTRLETFPKLKLCVRRLATTAEAIPGSWTIDRPRMSPREQSLRIDLRVEPRRPNTPTLPNTRGNQPTLLCLLATTTRDMTTPAMKI